MTCNIIATGSKGNAVLINDSILIDCGVPYKTLSEDPETIGRLRLVLLTHIHGDHTNLTTIRRIHKERPSVRFVCAPWMAPVLFRTGISSRKVDCLSQGEWYAYSDDRGGCMEIRCVETYHDVPNCAWDLRFSEESVFYATDCGNLHGVEARDRTLYLIEGNYKEGELQERARLKTESGEFSYEPRVAEFHLSEEQALRFLSENAGPSSKYVLIHRHEDSNKIISRHKEKTLQGTT